MIFTLTKHTKYNKFNEGLVMTNKKTYQKPEIKNLGSANEIIKGEIFNKEVGGADGLRDNDNNPVSVAD